MNLIGLYRAASDAGMWQWPEIIALMGREGSHKGCPYTYHPCCGSIPVGETIVVALSKIVGGQPPQFKRVMRSCGPGETSPTLSK